MEVGESAELEDFFYSVLRGNTYFKLIFFIRILGLARLEKI